MTGGDTVDDQVGVGGRVTPDHAQGDRAELVVPGRAADTADPAFPQFDVGTDLGKTLGGTVQVQHDQTTRWASQVVHACDRLLPRVAPLVQVDGAADPVDLVRNRTFIGVQPRTHPVLGDPVCLVCPYSGGTSTGLGQRLRGRHQTVHGQEQVGLALRSPYGHVVEVQGGHDLVPVRAEHGQDRAFLAEVGDFHPQHETHRVQERGQRGAVAGLGVDPHGLTVVDQGQVMSEMPPGVQNE